MHMKNYEPERNRFIIERLIDIHKQERLNVALTIKKIAEWRAEGSATAIMFHVCN